MSQTNKTVFPIITRAYSKENYDGHGSAFFIDPKGLFITAAHTFKHPFRDRCALIEGNRYEIKEVWSEYHDFDSQHPAIYKDLFIGRIDGLETPNHAILLEISDTTTPQSDIKILGYSVGLNNATISIDELDELNDSPSPEKLKEKLLKYQPLEASFAKPHFAHINKHSTTKYLFKNGFTIELNISEPHGHSGGPIVNAKSQVIGMLIGQNAGISSSYIAEKLLIAKSIEDDISPTFPSLAVPKTWDNEWLYKIMMSVHQKLNIKGSAYQTACEHLRFVSTDDLHLLNTPRISKQDPGFGLTEINYFLREENRIVHLVMVNPDAYKEAQLTKDEIEAILMHELGHILNTPALEKPIQVKSTSTEDLKLLMESEKEVKKVNSYNSEVYADDYVKQNGYRLPLISSLNKYLNLPTAKNRDMIELRILALTNEGSELKGSVATLTKIK